MTEKRGGLAPPMQAAGRRSRAVVLEEPGRFQERSLPVPAVGPEEFLLRVELVSICGGDPIEYEGRNRKAHYPLLLGHEVVGRVEALGELAAARHGIVVGSRVSVEPYIACRTCDHCLSGDYQFCRAGLVYGVTIPCTRPPFLWGAYSEYLYGAPGARVHRIEDDVPREAACLTSVVANGVRWVRTRGRGQVGEPVLILGSGAQALASVIVADAAGLSPIVVAARGRHRHKLDLAMRFGANAIVEVDEPGALERITGTLEGRDLPLAVEATGAEEMIALAVAALGPRGRLVLAGTRGGAPASLDIDAMVFKELDVLGGLGQAHDTELAAQIVNSRRYPIEAMLSMTLPLGEADEGIHIVMEGRGGPVRVGLDPAR
jgi:threonine dehydrogenase-like Zn-dependent dehydrogenase